MSQQSEDRLDEVAPPESDAASGARILRLRSTPYDLQKAIQQRAQESVEREAELDREARRPKPLKWLVIASIASIPIILTLTMAEGFLRAMHRYMETMSSVPQPAAQEEPVDTTESNSPNVILVQPLNIPEQAGAPARVPNNSTAQSTTVPGS